MSTQFIVHDPQDSVGVVTVEGVEAGQELTGWVMDTDETVKMTVRDAIPIGHKLAMRAIHSGGTILKYGHDIGRAVADIAPGEHVHVHNVKTKRW